jgi:hypothetical protein
MESICEWKCKRREGEEKIMSTPYDDLVNLIKRRGRDDDRREDGNTQF